MDVASGAYVKTVIIESVKISKLSQFEVSTIDLIKFYMEKRLKEDMIDFEIWGTKSTQLRKLVF